MINPNNVTKKQANWFKKVREGLENESGKSFDEWIEIARGCPETSHSKRLKWLKDNHDLGINRASVVLGAAFETGLGWDNPDELINKLWKNPELRDIYSAIEKYTMSLGDDVVAGPRKGFSGFSRKYQFAAARPVKGQVRLGLALDPVEHGLAPAKASESWSDRLTSVVTITTIDGVNAEVKSLIKTAWKAS